MRTLTEKEIKLASSMLAQASKYGGLIKDYTELASSGKLILDKLENHLISIRKIKIDDDHTFKFLGVQLQSSLEVLITNKLSAYLSIYQLIQEDGQVKRIKIVAIPYDFAGNVLYEDRFPEFIIGSIINYLQFNFNILPLVSARL